MAGGEPLRIGQVHWALPPTTGGVESHVADLALALADLGCSVIVLTGEPSAARLRGVEITHIPLLNLDLLRKSHWDPESLKTAIKSLLREAISGSRLQIVHGHNLHHFFSAPALALDELHQELGFRLHHTFHETWPDILHERPVYRRWEGNYAVSRFVQNQCRSHIGFTPQLRSLGVDIERFHALRPPMVARKEFMILHPARVLPWKGVHISVDMLAELKRRGIFARLVITDTQRIIDWDEQLISYRQQIHERMVKGEVADMIDFITVPYSDMPLLYEEADVVIYPTIGEEPFGLVPLEAMSMERPIVASRSGGMMETIVQGETGFLVERGNPLALADCVERLLRDPGLSREMGRAGRRHVAANFNGSEYAARLLQEYLLPDGGRSPLGADGAKCESEIHK